MTYEQINAMVADAAKLVECLPGLAPVKPWLQPPVPEKVGAFL